MSAPTPPVYHFAEYARALREHYPSFTMDPGLRACVEGAAAAGEAYRPSAERFQAPQRRHFGSLRNVWEASRGTTPSPVTGAYRGLLRMKTPFDVVLYSHLVWELRPRTILELGSLQGGSGLWFADLLESFGVEGAEVHSFDLLRKCVSPMARHPRLHFHEVDLKDVRTIDTGLLARLPHPWMVVEDSHVNMLAVMRRLDRHVEVGDYYVLEDVGLEPGYEFVEGLRAASELGYAIDTDYTDAFGYNVTAAANGWLRKMAKPGG